MSEVPGTPLRAAIRSLRDELVGAAQDGLEGDIKFSLGPIALDLEIAVTTTHGGEAGIRFWLVSLGGKTERSGATTHRIHLELQPLGPGNKNLIVGARSEEEQT